MAGEAMAAVHDSGANDHGVPVAMVVVPMVIVVPMIMSLSALSVVVVVGWSGRVVVGSVVVVVASVVVVVGSVVVVVASVVVVVGSVVVVVASVVVVVGSVVVVVASVVVVVGSVVVVVAWVVVVVGSVVVVVASVVVVVGSVVVVVDGTPWQPGVLVQPRMWVGTARIVSVASRADAGRGTYCHRYCEDHGMARHAGGDGAGAGIEGRQGRSVLPEDPDAERKSSHKDEDWPEE